MGRCACRFGLPCHGSAEVATAVLQPLMDVMAAWRMIGFPGAHVAYLEEVERHGVPFEQPPVSLIDFHDHGDGHEHGGLPAHAHR